MRGSSARGMRGAWLMMALFGAAVLAPRATGEAPDLHGAERWISAACGGAEEPCERWQGVRRLAALLDERMDAGAEDRLRLAAAIAEEAEEARLDPLFVLAVIEVESGFDQEAVSQRGALGLMQLKPSTLRREAERGQLEAQDLADPVLNVRAGIRYYRRLLDAFRQDQELALMAYNAGPARISRLRREEGGVPEYFRAYPRRVQAEFRRLRGDARARLALVDVAAPLTAMR
jgi:soluble lytic murein transglycosylase-like protein